MDPVSFWSIRGLHPNVAWAMVSAAQIQPGEVVLDPMCGTGMLLTEAPHCGLVIGAQRCATEMVRLLFFIVYVRSDDRRKHNATNSIGLDMTTN